MQISAKGKNKTTQILAGTCRDKKTHRWMGGGGVVPKVVKGFVPFSKPGPRSDRMRSSSVACADLAGLGLIAKKLMADDDENSYGQAERTFAAGVTRCFAEAAPQALLQSSILMVTDTELLEQPGLLASVMFSCITLFKNGISLARTSVGLLSCPASPLGLLGLAAAIAVLLVLTLVLAKLYAVEACQSRIWGPATGCIPLAGPQIVGKNR